MSWDAYITNLMNDGETSDAAIVGCEPGKESVWASHKCGTLAQITPDEIRKLAGHDRSGFFSGGLTVGGTRCTVLRDKLTIEDEHTMDVRSKSTETEPETYNICIGKSKTALVIVKGKKNVHGGRINTKVYEMSQYLLKSGY